MSRRTRGGVARAIRVGAAVAVAGIAGASPAAAAPSWLGTQTLGGADAAAVPQAAVDAAGDALVAYADDSGVVRATSRPAGAAAVWGAPASLGSGTVPRLAMNAAGRAVVVYRDSGGTISAAVRDDVAGAWSAPVALTASPVPAGVVLRVALDAAGDAVAAWNTSAGTVEAAARPARRRLGRRRGPVHHVRQAGAGASTPTATRSPPGCARHAASRASARRLPASSPRGAGPTGPPR